MILTTRRDNQRGVNYKTAERRKLHITVAPITPTYKKTDYGTEPSDLFHELAKQHAKLRYENNSVLVNA